MRRLLFAVLCLVPSLLWGAAGDILSVTVNATADSWLRGWTADIVIEGLGTSGTYDFGLGTNNRLTGAEKVKLTVTSHSWSATGTATTIVRTVYGQRPLRKAYPDTTDPDAPVWSETFSGGNTTIRVVLSDSIYAEDDTGAGSSGTAITATIGSGFYTHSGTPNNAASGMTVTNDSTLAFFNVGAHWTVVSKRLIHDDFKLGVVAFHHHYGRFRPVRVVKFTITDQHSNTVTLFAEDMTIDRTVTHIKPFAEYWVTVPVAGFTDGDTLTCNAGAYPWVGDNPKDSSAGPAEPTPAFGPRTFLLDRANTYGETAALVDAATGVDPGAADDTKVYPLVSFNPATAYKFLTAGRAFASIKLYNNNNHTRNDISASWVFANAGSYTWLGSTNTLGGSVAARPTFAAAAGVPAADVIISGSSGGSNDLSANQLRLRGVKITTAGANTFDDSTDIWTEDCITDTSNTQLYNETGQAVFVTGGSIPQLGQGLRAASATNMGFGLVRSVDLTGFGGTIHFYNVVGCRGTGMVTARFLEQTAGQTAPLDSAICFNNEFLGLTASGADIARFGVTSADSPGTFIIQTVFEQTAAGASGIISWFTGDLNYTMGSGHAYVSAVGQRNFINYNDTGSINYDRIGFMEYFCYWDRWANKVDLLSPADTNRRGGWSTTMGVSRWGNWREQNMISLPGDNFFSEFPGIGSYEPAETNEWTDSALFIARKSASDIEGTTAGAGSGNYGLRASSPLASFGSKSGMPEMLPFDIDGNPRENNDSAGAYTLPQNTFRVKTRHGKSRSL